VLKCQKDIGKRTAKFFDAVEKALAKCQDALIKGKVPSCPDSKAADKITKASAKLDAAIAKTCTGASTISGGAKPSVILGQSTRFGACPQANTQTPAGLSGTLGCLTQAAASCDVGLTVGDPTCSVLLCGNGQIDAGETCDDGNTVADTGFGPDDICPPDCSVAACSVTGTQSVTVQLTTATPLVSALVLVGYDDNKVSIPGIGSQASVINSVTSGVFATSPDDTDTALRIDLEDPSFVGIGSGPAATVTFNTCTGTPVTAADFNCVVVSAGDTSTEVFGATCAVTVP
jgi:cysteine-rich repeat protein